MSLSSSGPDPIIQGKHPVRFALRRKQTIKPNILDFNYPRGLTVGLCATSQLTSQLTSLKSRGPQLELLCPILARLEACLVLLRPSPHQSQLLLVRVKPEAHPQVGHVGLLYVVALRAGLPVQGGHPVHLALGREAGVKHAVAGYLTQVGRAQLPDLNRNIERVNEAF